MPEATTLGVLEKKVFFKMSQNSQETTVPEETPVFCKFLRTPLLQNIALLLWLKSQGAREASHHPVFMEICPAISHRY